MHAHIGWRLEPTTSWFELGQVSAEKELSLSNNVLDHIYYWTIPENIHTAPMDDIENPVAIAQWVWLEIHEFPQNFVFVNFWPEFQENHSKSCKILEFLKILNQQALDSAKNCYSPSWKSWNF